MGTSRREQGLYLGVATLAGLVGLDLWLGREGNFAGAVVVAPVLAAALAGPSSVITVGLATVLASIGLSIHDEAGLVPSFVRCGVALVGSLTAIWVTQRRNATASRLGQISRVADLVQEALLDPIPDRIGPAGFGGWYISATEEARVGGDFFHASEYKGRARWIIGDVRGKGVSAVRAAAAAIGAFREAAEQADTLGEVLVRVDHRIRQYFDTEDFATALLAELTPEGALEILNCGHPPPLRLTSAAPELMAPERATTPLGWDPLPHPQECRLSPGEKIWFFTDGVLEARLPDGTRGLDASCIAYGLGSLPGSSVPAVLLERIRSTVGSELDDDSAALVVDYLADPPLPQ